MQIHNQGSIKISLVVPGLFHFKRLDRIGTRGFGSMETYGEDRDNDGNNCG